MNVVGVGVNVDGSQVVEVVHDDSHGGDVGGCCPLYGVQNVAGEKEMKHGEDDEDSCVDEVIETVLELAWQCDWVVVEEVVVEVLKKKWVVVQEHQLVVEVQVLGGLLARCQ